MIAHLGTNRETIQVNMLRASKLTNAIMYREAGACLQVYINPLMPLVPYAYILVVSSPDQIFRVHPVDSSKNRVWTLSLQKLGQVYIWRAVNWVIVGVNYIVSNQQRLLWRQKNLKAGYL